MVHTSDKLRVGILLDAMTAPAWIRRTLELIRAEESIAIALVILPAAPDSPRSKKFDFRHALFRAYMRFEKIVCGSRTDAFAPKDLRELLDGVETMTIEPARREGKTVFRDEDVEAVRARRLDVLVPFGFGQLAGDILTSARYGTWAYRHLDVDTARGTMAGFWEVFERHPVTGSALQILDASVFGGRIVTRAFSATNRFSVYNNRNKNFWKSTALLPRKLRELHDRGEDAFFERVRRLNPALHGYDHRMYDIPSNGAFLRAFIRHAARSAGILLTECFTRESWLIRGRVDEGLSLEFYDFDIEITPPRGRLYADPHVVKKDERYYIFFEDSPTVRDQGVIRMVEMDAQGRMTEPVTVLERPYHLAYPSVIEQDGEYYMIPDTGAHRCVEAYRCEEFPRKWSFFKTLIPDVRAVDPTLFEHNGRWWMLVSMIEHEAGSFSDELFLFHADHPLSDQWTPHPLNPIVTDARKSRPAGRVLEIEGRKYRLSQNGTRGYGYGINLHEIVTLTETDYEEKDTQSLEPLWSKQYIGMHTLAHAGNLTLIDVKRRVFRWW